MLKGASMHDEHDCPEGHCSTASSSVLVYMLGLKSMLAIVTQGRFGVGILVGGRLVERMCIRYVWAWQNKSWHKLGFGL